MSASAPGAVVDAGAAGAGAVIDAGAAAPGTVVDAGAAGAADTAEAVCRREGSAVLRIGEDDGERLEAEAGTSATSMVMNMGPQHPSTHGVLRLMLEMDGETVMRSKPVIGYLHTGMEKTAETLTYLQGPTNVTRMDYASPLFSELAFSMATEALLGLELPPRAVWIRMLMCELNRISSHLLFQATNGMDIGAVSMMLYGWREREEVLRLLEKITGLRMNHNYIRPGGVAADLPDGWRDGVLSLIDTLPARLDEFDTLLTGQPIYRQRLQGVGVINPAECLALGVTGPILRSTGYAWDLRRDMPYLAYDQVDFDVVVGTYGDCFDRYAIRLNEIRESIRIVAQILDRMPAGDYRVQDKKVTPPPRARIDESMEALIHHFKIFTEGFKVPAGEVYAAVESPRGELGCYMVSDGSAVPYRMHIRGPSFVNLQTLPHLMRGGLVADAVAIISSVDPIMGEVDR
ncbi:NADH-quinone oxidoreductase subunit D [Candidatus Poriferisocius sp.]|uniref:NADH-quinone oxidoreductase subunit D n=1 Tax=Candidatus Poriferisocius sp. TaxID=3101276 RepID=UPI003B023435